MTRTDANVFLAAILETVAATPGGAPSGHMYAALMGRIDLTDYQALLAIATETGLITTSRAHVVTITEKGRGIVRKIAAHKVPPSTGAQMPCGTYRPGQS